MKDFSLHKSGRRIGICVLLVLFLAGCGPMTGASKGTVHKETMYPVIAADPAAYTGSNVLWGGTILETRIIPGGSELVVEQAPLNFRQRPDPNITRGMFLAKTFRVISPEEYGKGKLITVAGEIVGEERRRVGAEEYVFPVVAVREMYVWSEGNKVAPPRAYGWDWGAFGHHGPLEQEWRPSDEPPGDFNIMPPPQSGVPGVDE